MAPVQLTAAQQIARVEEIFRELGKPESETIVSPDGIVIPALTTRIGCIFDLIQTNRRAIYVSPLTGRLDGVFVVCVSCCTKLVETMLPYDFELAFLMEARRKSERTKYPTQFAIALRIFREKMRQLADEVGEVA